MFPDAGVTVGARLAYTSWRMHGVLVKGLPRSGGLMMLNRIGDKRLRIIPVGPNDDAASNPDAAPGQTSPSDATDPQPADSQPTAKAGDVDRGFPEPADAPSGRDFWGGQAVPAARWEGSETRSKPHLLLSLVLSACWLHWSPLYWSLFCDCTCKFLWKISHMHQNLHSLIK